MLPSQLVKLPVRDLFCRINRIAIAAGSDPSIRSGIVMAYTLGDPFRPLRIILRVNGILLGLLLGALFLLLPDTILIRWGLAANDLPWSLRLAGASQIALGCFLLIASGQHYMNRVLLFTAALTHVLWVLTLLSAYLQQALATLLVTGRILPILIFLLCLIGAVAPLRYVRSSD